MKNTFSFEEVTQLLLDERTRALEIALSFKKLHQDKFAEEQKQKLADITYTNKEKAHVSKIIAENILGISPAQQILAITEKQIITQKLIDYCNARKRNKK